ncbi:recombinase family protein [Paracoccus rhizosphaerae]|uniref:Recombinase family protein n=1 Tax=Paracoccus rhizosphaerae TaxID=1133347 RepID=A0ABV6CJ64_9RHOB|nr:recombinase family protein [Paracoccus rhizosphaerae]
MSNETIALIYLRSAVHDEAAVAEQRRICTGHAAAQGWTIGEIFVDNGASGMTNKDGFRALCEAVSAGRADIVLAQDLGRISRDIDACVEFVRMCETCGVCVICVHGGTIRAETLQPDPRSVHSALTKRGIAARARR